MSEWIVTHGKAASFYHDYFRKDELQHQTHYCPGCGHGQVHKLIAAAIDDLHIQDRVVLISPVGCAVFAYYYFDVGNIQAAHGRAAAVATGVKRGRPEAVVISYQGDGDLAAIGTAEMIHSANRGENITVIFVNNAIYGMTGGQMAPTTLLGQKTSTTPHGRSAEHEGYPLRVCELLATLEAPVYLERVALSDNKQIMRAARAIKRGLENQVRGLGFSLVEVLSPCPTIWRKTPLEAQAWVRDEMTKVFPPGVYRDRIKDATPRPAPPAHVPEEQVPGRLGISPNSGATEAVPRDTDHTDLRIKIAGFGGQGVLMLGEVLAEAGLRAGLQVSWLPSYGPEMRSGTSNCHVRLSAQPIDSPLVSRPTVLIAMNEPSLRKFLPAVESGGWVFYNADEIPADCMRDDVHLVSRAATKLADEIGDVRVANIVMLGLFLESSRVLSDDRIDSALSCVVKSRRLLELDRLALRRGGQAAASQTERNGNTHGTRTES